MQRGFRNLHFPQFGLRCIQMGQYFDSVYYPMREKYGDWHGFNEMFVLNLVRDVTGESLGY